MTMCKAILSWLRRHRERARLIDADSDMLVRELGPDAYAEARIMQRWAKSAEDRRHWGGVALAIARKTGKRVGLDTATRTALDADLRDRGGAASPEIKPRKVDPIDELKRLIGDGA